MMYEPPNRGGKTHGTLNRGAGGNDPGAVTDAAVLANTFLWPRGYTTVWSGWEDCGRSPAHGDVDIPVAKNPDGSTITGPAYEYIVTGGATFGLELSRRRTSGRTQAKLTHRVHLDDAPGRCPLLAGSYTDASARRSAG